ncbi:MAG: hypothetical protein R3C15_22200 [Thermoleophilia bacterium]
MRSRRWIAWLVSAPLAVAGSLAAHQAGFLLAFPEPSVRDARLAATGHGYLDHLSFGLAVAFALALAALAVQALDASRGDRGDRGVARTLFLVPPAAFVVQEVVERLVQSGQHPAGLLGERSFLVGLALQLPFALAAWLVARALLRCAVRLGAWLGRALPADAPGALAAGPQAARAGVLPRDPLVAARPPRGPPLR